MTIFSQQSSADGARSGNRASPPGESGLTIIATGTRIEGQLDTQGVVKIEGTFVGTIRAVQQVLIAQGGLVDGDVVTKEAVVGGEVRGSIMADERVEVQSTSLIKGDIITRRIVVQEGGEVNGHVRMGAPDELLSTPRTRVSNDAEIHANVEH